VSENVESRYLAMFEAHVRNPEPGALRFDDGQLDHAWAVRRGRRLEVWSIPMLARLMDTQLDQAPVYHEFVEPAGMTHGAIVTAPVSSEEAILGMSHSQPGRTDFCERRALGLMRLVAPAFKAEVDTLLRLQPIWSSLARTLDDLAHALAVFDAGGRLL
jgi:hypothetical protein